jgi:hypothetical protein
MPIQPVSQPISLLRRRMLEDMAMRGLHHAPQRLVETASTAARAWNLLPGPADGAEQP